MNSSQILHGMPIADYHSHPSLSNSMLKWLSPQYTPLDFWCRSWMNPSKVPFKVTDALTFGQQGHCLTLEGEAEFFKHWQISTKMIGGKPVATTKEEGMVTQAQYDLLRRLRDALLAHPLAGAMLAGAQREVSMFAEVPVMRHPEDTAPMLVAVRCRHDAWKPGLSGDVKFVDSLDYVEVPKDIANYGYGGQAWFYPVVMAACSPEMPKQEFVTIFIEKQAPHKILVVTYSDATMQVEANRGYAKLMRYVEMMDKHGTKEWPGFPHAVHTMVPPTLDRAILNPHDLEMPRYWEYAR